MEIPLFPLHTVLCPGIVLPLHIFEDRYRALTRHCLDSGAPFGVVLIRDGREVGSGGSLELAGVGALVEIREAGRYPDGRYDLLAAATGRFVIDAVDPGREPYLVADVTPLDEQVGDEARAERLAATAIRRFVRYLELMRAREGETSEVLDVRVEFDSDSSSGGAAGDEGDVTDDEAADDELRDDQAADDGSIFDGFGGEGDDAVVAGALPVGALEIESVGPATDRGRPRDLAIPDDPTVLSYLLSGIIQIELPRRQALLEAATTCDRLEALVRLLDREVVLLTSRLRLFAPDQRVLRGPRRS